MKMNIGADSSDVFEVLRTEYDDITFHIDMIQNGLMSLRCLITASHVGGSRLVPVYFALRFTTKLS